jgi:hypothetical protein
MVAYCIDMADASGLPAQPGGHSWTLGAASPAAPAIARTATSTTAGRTEVSG